MQRMKNENAMKKGHRAGLAEEPLWKSAAQRSAGSKTAPIRFVMSSAPNQSNFHATVFNNMDA